MIDAVYRFSIADAREKYCGIKLFPFSILSVFWSVLFDVFREYALNLKAVCEIRFRQAPGKKGLHARARNPFLHSGLLASHSFASRPAPPSRDDVAARETAALLRIALTFSAAFFPARKAWSEL